MIRTAQPGNLNVDENFDEDRRIAHHEAAHAVASVIFVGGLSSGIDLDAENLATGGLGHAGIRLFAFDLRNLGGPPLRRRHHELADQFEKNMLIILAGSAADARVTGTITANAIRQQHSDLAEAELMLDRMHLTRRKRQERLSEMFALADEMIADDDIWALIEATANEVLNRRKIDAPALEAVIRGLRPDMLSST
jgi:hypothetical protein